MKQTRIVIMGLDGCGKTTQANLLHQKLNELGIASAVIWLRGQSYLTLPLIKIGKFILRAPEESKRGQGIGKRSYQRYVSGKKSLFRNAVARGIWRNLTILDAYLSLRFAVKKVEPKTSYFIFDRYIYDTLIDIDTSFGAGGSEVKRLLKSRLTRCFPRPDLAILLDIEPQEAIKRKDDIPSIEYLDERYPLYRLVAQSVGARIIDATQSIHEIAGEIFTLVEGVGA